MELTLRPTQIAAVWEAVSSPLGHPHPKLIAEIVAEVVKAGWAPFYRVEDLLYALGCRSWYARGRDMADLFGIPHQSVYRPPAASSDTAYGFSEVRAADLAAMLILMERCGFPVDPTPLVDALRPIIRRQSVITGAELHVMWFAQERHRMEPVTLTSPGARWSIRPDETVTLPTGYRAELWRNDDKTPARFIVTKPKRGHRKLAA